MYTCGIRINAKLVKEGSFRMNAKLVKEELMVMSFKAKILRNFILYLDQIFFLSWLTEAWNQGRNVCYSKQQV